MSIWLARRQQKTAAAADLCPDPQPCKTSIVQDTGQIRMRRTPDLQNCRSCGCRVYELNDDALPDRDMRARWEEVRRESQGLKALLGD